MQMGLRGPMGPRALLDLLGPYWAPGPLWGACDSIQGRMIGNACMGIPTPPRITPGHMAIPHTPGITNYEE